MVISLDMTLVGILGVVSHQTSLHTGLFKQNAVFFLTESTELIVFILNTCHLQKEKEQSLSTFLWQVLVSTLIQNTKSDTEKVKKQQQHKIITTCVILCIFPLSPSGRLRPLRHGLHESATVNPSGSARLSLHESDLWGLVPQLLGSTEICGVWWPNQNLVAVFVFVFLKPFLGQFS